MDGKPASYFKDFRNYTEAKRKGDKVVADLAKSRAVGLTPGQRADAVAALNVLQQFYVDTGKRLSLLDSFAG